MPARWRLIVLTLVVGLGITHQPGPAHAADSPAGRLAAKYAPVLAVEPQEQPCGPGEPYRPTSVDLVLNRRGVVLRGPDGGVVKRAPTAADLFGRGEGYYLDLPGDPLNPGCTYERDFRNWSSGRKPSVYAHLASDPRHPGRLAVQYWLYYTFNDFTDKHESDWEMVQVDFDASTARQALRMGPYEVDVAQHAGGERSDWSDPKLEKRDTHPVIHVATGSHADYFGSALYLGRTASEGFGCDDTRNTTALVRPRVTLLPDVPSSASSPYAWLAFQGRWGQAEKGLNNGPTGPSEKSVWSRPFQWSRGLRDSSVRVPSVEPIGLSVTGFFCAAVTRGSIILNWALVHPWVFLALLGALVVAAVAAVRHTTWTPPDPRPLRERRGSGQILRAALRLYRSAPRTFVGIGAIFVPISLLAAALQWVVFHLTGVESMVALDGRQGAITALLALLIGGTGATIASVVTTAAVAAALHELDADRPVSARHAFRIAFARGRGLAGAAARQIAAVALLTVTVVGAPFAIYIFVRWSLFAQTCVLERTSGRRSLHRSADLVRGRWWRTFAFTALVDALALLSGPLLGLGLLLLTDRSLDFINVTGSVIYALTVPYAAISLTLYYFDLEARGVVQPESRKRATRAARSGLASRADGWAG